MKVCVVIPTYNESKTIGNLVKEVIKKGYDTVVIDDGSKDASAHLAKKAGAYVLQNKKNLGKGLALRVGFKYCIDQDYDAIVTMDADNQHHPEDIIKLIDAAKEKDTGIVVGNRMFYSKGMPLVRWLTNKTMSLIISLACKQLIPDSQCGFRLIKKDILKDINLKTKKFEIESELLIKAAKLRYKIKSTPIKTIYEGQKSQINPFVDTFRFIKYIIAESFEK